MWGACAKTYLLWLQSYSGAREAVSYRGIYGATRAINITEIAPKVSGEAAGTSEADLTKLFKMVRLGEEEEVGSAVAAVSAATRFFQWQSQAAATT